MAQKPNKHTATDPQTGEVAKRSSLTRVYAYAVFATYNTWGFDPATGKDWIQTGTKRECIGWSGSREGAEKMARGRGLIAGTAVIVPATVQEAPLAGVSPAALGADLTAAKAEVEAEIPAPAPATTVQELAAEWASHFHDGPRVSEDTGRTIRTIFKGDGEPSALATMIQDAHGSLLPDDFRYEFIEGALLAIRDSGDCRIEDLDTTEDEYANPDGFMPYTAERLRWLASSLQRPGYCDEAVANGLVSQVTEPFLVRSPSGGLSYRKPAPVTLQDLIAAGIYAERVEVFGIVLNALQEALEGRGGPGMSGTAEKYLSPCGWTAAHEAHVNPGALENWCPGTAPELTSERVHSAKCAYRRLTDRVMGLSFRCSCGMGTVA